MTIYDQVDLSWDALNGDLELGPDGDVGDTSRDVLKAFRAEVQNRVKSAFGDWRIHPNQAASLESLIGQPFNTNTAEDGIAKIITALTMNNFVARQDISIRWFPLDRNKVLYDMKIKCTPTTLNNNSRELGFTFLYDSFENEVRTF